MAARVICVGDENQSIYLFRGADSDALLKIKEMMSKSDLGMALRDLPVNYRSDQAIIEHAQQWVPKLKGHSKAWGTVASITFEKAINRANNDGTDIALPDGIEGAMRTLPIPGKKPSTFAFLCRINLPLVVTAYQLIAQRKRCCIIGRNQIGLPLKNIIQAICGNPSSKAYTNRITDKLDSDGDAIEEGLLTRLKNYYTIQSAKLKKEGFESKLEALQQNVECIEVIAQQVLDDSVSTLIKEIDTLFVEDQQPGVISLSTVHRAKGLEWDVVFILRPDLMPHPKAMPNPDGSWSEAQQQEQNCEYIAWTRARHRSYAVGSWPFGRQQKTYIETNIPAEETNQEQESVSVNRSRELDSEWEAELEMRAIEGGDGYPSRSPARRYSPPPPLTRKNSENSGKIADDGLPF